MMSCKRIGAVVCAALIMTVASLMAWANDVVETSCQVVNDTVIISGKVAQPGTRPIGIVVVKPGESLAAITAETLDQVINQSIEVESASDGSFSMNYVMDDKKGTYTVYITTPESTQPVVTTFDYCSPDEILQAVQQASRDEIEAVLTEYAKYIGIDLTDEGLYHGLSSKDAVLDQMQQSVFASPTEIKSTFVQLVALAALSEATESSIAKVMDALLPLMDVEIQTEYEELENTYKKNVEKTMLAGKPYADMTEAAAQFKEGVVLARIKQAGYPDNGTLLKQYTEIGVDLNGAYANLSLTKQAEVLKALAENNFATYEELKSFFDKKVDELAANSSSGGSVSGGGGGAYRGSGGGSVGLEVDLKDNTQPEQGDIFSDLGEAEWARESITELGRRGVVSGVGDGKFEPNRPVTREEFVKMLVAAVGAEHGGEISFTDVDPSAWYYSYISVAAANGLIVGYPDGEFGIGEEISRQDIAVMVQRAAQVFGYPLTKVNDKIEFIDDGSIAEYAKDAVYTMQGAGLMNGTDGAHFEPNTSATRAMVAKVLYELLQTR